MMSHDEEFSVDFENDVVNCKLTTDGTTFLPVQVLIDSEASAENFVSTEVARWRRKRSL